MLQDSISILLALKQLSSKICSETVHMWSDVLGYKQIMIQNSTNGPEGIRPSYLSFTSLSYFVVNRLQPNCLRSLPQEAIKKKITMHTTHTELKNGERSTKIGKPMKSYDARSFKKKG